MFKRHMLISGIIILLFIFFTSIPTCAGSTVGVVTSNELVYNQFVIMDVSPDELNPGDIKTIDITIKNIRGNPVYDVSANINQTSGYLIIKNELLKHHSGKLYPDQTCTFQYEVYVKENAPKGVYYLPLNVMWTAIEQGSVQIQKNLEFGMEIVRNPEDVKIDIVKINTPMYIEAGDDFIIDIAFKNVGVKKATSIEANLPLVYLFKSIGSDTEIFIPSLEPNETAVIKYHLQVDKQVFSMLHNFDFILKYRDQNNKVFTKKSSFGINIEEVSSLFIQDITIEPVTISPKTEGLFMIQLINAGTNPVDNVKVTVYGGDKILGQSHNFIGQINPQESKTTSFGVYVDPKAKIGKYGLNILVSYDMLGGTEHTISNIYFTNVIPAKSIIPFERNDVYLISVFIGYLLLSYLIFQMTVSKIVRLDAE